MNCVKQDSAIITWINDRNTLYGSLYKPGQLIPSKAYKLNSSDAPIFAFTACCYDDINVAIAYIQNLNNINHLFITKFDGTSSTFCQNIDIITGANSSEGLAMCMESDTQENIFIALVENNNSQIRIIKFNPILCSILSDSIVHSTDPFLLQALTFALM